MSTRSFTSAFEQLGPHLLGRLPSTRDARDWQMADFLLPPPDDSLLGKTVEQILREQTYFASWPGILIFWHWARHHQPVAPGPGPAPVPPHPAPGPGSPHEWHDTIQLDQGQTNHCVGFGWAAWGDCAPIEDRFQNADADAIYYQCKVEDGQPGQENGSSVRAGAKVMQGRGRLGAYVFASATDELKLWVTSHGPVVIGSDWTEDMFQPDVNGLVRPTGPVRGGHCYLLLGYDPASDLFQFDNSWGTGWGKNGRFFMSADDFDRLVIQNPSGEACAGLELPVIPQPTPTPEPTPTPPPGPPAPADAHLDSVYHNYRLQVLHTNQEFTGTVTAVRSEADGDTHVEVTPDPAYAALAYTGQNYVVVEPMPGQSIPTPSVGDHIHVVGTHVYDTNHAHNEIHPVLSWNGLSYEPHVPPLFSGRFPNIPGPFALSEQELTAEQERSAEA